MVFPPFNTDHSDHSKMNPRGGPRRRALLPTPAQPPNKNTLSPAEAEPEQTTDDPEQNTNEAAQYNGGDSSNRGVDLPRTHKNPFSVAATPHATPEKTKEPTNDPQPVAPSISLPSSVSPSTPEGSYYYRTVVDYMAFPLPDGIDPEVDDDDDSEINVDGDSNGEGDGTDESVDEDAEEGTMAMLAEIARAVEKVAEQHPPPQDTEMPSEKDVTPEESTQAPTSAPGLPLIDHNAHAIAETAALQAIANSSDMNSSDTSASESGPPVRFNSPKPARQRRTAFRRQWRSTHPKISSLERSARDAFMHASDDIVFVDDGINMNRLTRLAIGLGPKFVFPGQLRRREERMDLYITIAQLIGAQRSLSTARMAECQRMADLAFVEHFDQQGHAGIDDRENWTDVESVLAEAFSDAKRFLRNNPDIMVSESDKGKRVVVCLKSTWNALREKVLADGISKGVYTCEMAKLPLGMMWSELLEKQRKAIATKATDALRDITTNVNFYICGGSRTPTPADTIMHRRSPAMRQRMATLGPRQITAHGHSKLGLMMPPHDRFKADLYTLGRLRISIKVHKPIPYPARCIVTASDSIGKELEEYIHQFLKLFVIPLPHNNAEHGENAVPSFILYRDFIINNTNSVLDDIQRKQIPADHQMYTLDHTDMYTNVDLETALKIIDRDFDNTIGDRIAVPKELFVECVRFFMHHNSYFQAGGRIYKQAKGLTMGGKLSYILAEIVTANGLISAIKELYRTGVRISSLYKYVDDIFVTCNGSAMNHLSGRTNIDTIAATITRHLNGMGTTVANEQASDGIPSITYLDLSILRVPHPSKWNEQSLKTAWYRPAYKSARTINRFSAQPAQTKTNTVYEMIRRAVSNTSSDMLHCIGNQLHDVLTINGYSSSFIRTMMTKACKSCKKPHTGLINSLSAQPHTNTQTHSRPPTATAAVHSPRTVAVVHSPQAAAVVHSPRSTQSRPSQGTDQEANGNSSDAGSGGPRKRKLCDECGTRYRAHDATMHTCEVKRTYTVSTVATMSITPPLTTITTVAVERGPRIPRLGERISAPVVTGHDIEYMQCPHAEGLTERLRTIFAEYGIGTKLASPALQSPLFSLGKDPMSINETKYCTFGAPCFTCDTMVIGCTHANTLDDAIVIAQRQHVRGIIHDSQHTIAWDQVRVIKRHRTQAKAFHGHKLLRQLCGQGGENPPLRASILRVLSDAVEVSRMREPFEIDE